MRGEVRDVKADELNRFASQRPLMEELYFPQYRITPDDAILFIRQLNSLTRIEFQLKDRTEYDHLINQLDEKWQHQISPNGYMISIFANDRKK